MKHLRTQLRRIYLEGLLILGNPGVKKTIYRSLNRKKTDAIHLFLLSPPVSGSTVIKQVIETSPAVTSLPVEGQFLPELRATLLVDERWNPALPVDWTHVRDIFNGYWSPFRPIRFEKTPAHLVRDAQLQAEFPNAYFLVNLRDPYAFVEGILRRMWTINAFGVQSTPGAPASLERAAAFWVQTARAQWVNRQQLQNRLCFTYEQLTGQSESVLRSIENFVPGLAPLSERRRFHVANITQKPLVGLHNLNRQKVARLTDQEHEQINGVLRNHQDLLAEWGYAIS